MSERYNAQKENNGMFLKRSKPIPIPKITENDYVYRRNRGMFFFRGDQILIDTSN